MIIPDEQLDYLADRFLTFSLQALTGATFAQYVSDPEGWDQVAFILIQGDGINICEGQGRIVTLH